MSQPHLVQRARVASLTRSRPSDDPDLVAARQELRATLLERDIARALAGAPPLPPERRARIAALITDPAQGGDAA